MPRRTVALLLLATAAALETLHLSNKRSCLFHAPEETTTPVPLVVVLRDASFGVPGGSIAVGTYVSSGVGFWRDASPGSGPFCAYARSSTRSSRCAVLAVA